jgi:hypothetical protein
MVCDRSSYVLRLRRDHFQGIALNDRGVTNEIRGVSFAELGVPEITKLIMEAAQRGYQRLATIRGCGQADSWRADRRPRLGAWVRSFADKGLHWLQIALPPASISR